MPQRVKAEEGCKSSSGPGVSMLFVSVFVVQSEIKLACRPQRTTCFSQVGWAVELRIVVA